MVRDRPDGWMIGGAMSDLERELTMHLERAHELGERMKRSNTAVDEELRRTRQIADALMGVAREQR